MSVRRLADDAVQPGSFKFNRAMSAEAKGWIRKYPKGREQSAVIPLLMLAQEQEGWVTKAAIEHVSAMLDMPLIRVLEVATFYTQFQLKPVGTRAHIQVCGTTPCMLRGAEELKQVCRNRIHQDQFVTNEAGTLSWEEVECLGACVNAPMVMIFKDTYEDLTPERLGEIIDAFDAGKGDTITPGPQNGRMVSAPITGLTSLTEEAGPTIKLARTAKAVTPKPARKPGATVSGGNPTIKLAATAAGRAKAKPAKAETAPADKNRPAAVKKPAKPDDLKLISGVGPKLEGVLNKLGIYTWKQVASWKKAERDWVDGYLNFKGRIERDDWVKQAKALAKGGEAEYVRVFGKKPR
ncbi:MAG: NADH-quinone oxidoreductase subunit NuoE [Rhizobiaceae bacterium]